MVASSPCNGIRRRTFLKTGATALAWAALVRRAAANASPPNIVLIIGDDLGAHDLGCTGSRFHETPHIDRLAAEGMRFTQAYAAAPVCTPTRASLLTGRYPARLGLTNIIDGTLAQPDSPVIAAPFGTELPADCFTLAEALREQGYHCANLGKWHLGGAGSLPRDHGFHEEFLSTKAGSVKGFSWPDWKDLAPQGNFDDGASLTGVLNDTACRFLERPHEKPFFLVLSHYAPHTPVQAPPELVAKYEAKRAAHPEGFGSQCNPTYAAMIESIDGGVGRMLDTLERQGLAEHTLVAVLSDNGGVSLAMAGTGTPTSNAPLREGKGFLYEGGIRIPLVVRWPGVVPAGSWCDTPVITQDWYATLCAAAGCPPDARAGAGDACDLTPCLRDPSAALPREALFWHFPHFSNRSARPAGAVRCGPWKLVESYEDGSVALFNLDNDPGETHSLAVEQPDRVREMHARLQRWRSEAGAVMPTPNPALHPAQAGRDR